MDKKYNIGHPVRVISKVDYYDEVGYIVQINENAKHPIKVVFDEYDGEERWACYGYDDICSLFDSE